MIRLHHCHQTRSMRVLWLLDELDVPFELVLHPFDATLRTPEYRSLHPAGRVPALEIDGDVVWESGAMIEILCERFPGTGLGRAPGDPDRADWLVWVHFAETISQHVAVLVQQHIMLREDRMRSPTVMKLEALRLGKCFAVIEGRLSTPVENRDHLLTSGFSAADIAVGQAVYMARHFAPGTPFPEMQKWFARLTGRPAYQAVLPGDSPDRLFDREFYPPWPEDPRV